MNEYAPEELLDYVLNIMNAWELEHPNSRLLSESIIQLAKETKNELGKFISHERIALLNSILDKLKKDELINFDGETTSPQHIRQYYVTFEGKMAYKYGHYVQKRINEQAESNRLGNLEKNQQENANQMTSLTRVLAYATIALVIVEIIKLLIEHNPFSCQ